MNGLIEVCNCSIKGGEFMNMNFIVFVKILCHVKGVLD